MPGHLPRPGAGLDRRDNAIGDGLVDVESLLAHGASPVVRAAPIAALPATGEAGRGGRRTPSGATTGEGLPLAADEALRQVNRTSNRRAGRTGKRPGAGETVSEDLERCVQLIEEAWELAQAAGEGDFTAGSPVRCRRNTYTRGFGASPTPRFYFSAACAATKRIANRQLICKFAQTREATTLWQAVQKATLISARQEHILSRTDTRNQVSSNEGSPPPVRASICKQSDSTPFSTAC